MVSSKKTKNLPLGRPGKLPNGAAAVALRQSNCGSATAFTGMSVGSQWAARGKVRLD